MNIPVTIDLHIFCLMILIILFFYVKNNRGGSLSPMLFNWIIVFLGFTLFTEAAAWTLAWYDRDTAYWLYFLTLSTSSLQSVAWVAYFDYKVYGDTVGLRKRLLFYGMTPILILLVMIYNIISPGFVFELDMQGHIAWGVGSWLPPMIVYLLVLLSFIFFWRNKIMIHGRLTQVLLLFILLPLIGSIIQQFAVGIPVNWAFYTLALVLTFITVEMGEMYRDDLTKLPTRRQLEKRLAFKLHDDLAFCVVMMDLDNFKTINDTRGHMVGDKVLKSFAQILLSSIRPQDAACRVGGDEFMLIIETADDLIIADIINTIDEKMKAYMDEIDLKNVGVSYGIEKLLDPSAYELDTLLQSIDQKMYLHKKHRKAHNNHVS